MQLDRTTLNGDVRRVVRLVGDDLLARVRSRAESLRANDEPEALHDFRVAVRRLRSWLRAFQAELDDTLRGKHRRRLDRIGEATRESRDLEVHIEWVERFAHARRKHKRPGSDWLVARLRARKARADLGLRRALDDDLERTDSAIRKALGRFTVDLNAPAVPFARVAARLIRDQADASRSALSCVSSIGDRVAGHEARIAAKRLRYLLEPLREAVPRVDGVVERLSALQDALGALHDAQIFGSEIARLLAKVLTSSEKNASRGESTPDGAAENDRTELLLAISRRLHRDEVAVFRGVTETWLEDRTGDLWTDIESVAHALDDLANEAHSVERRYLLRAMVTDLPPARATDVDEGFLPGERIVERVRRVTTDDGTHYVRAITHDDGIKRTETVEAIEKPLFSALWPLTKGRRWRARRLSIDLDGRCWTIDEFRDRALVLARVVVAGPHEAVAIPAWLEASVERDVTDDGAYDAGALASAPAGSS